MIHSWSFLYQLIVSVEVIFSLSQDEPCGMVSLMIGPDIIDTVSNGWILFRIVILSDE